MRVLKSTTVGASDRWAGLLLMSDGRLRRKLNPVDGYRTKNLYYFEVDCSGCGVPMLQSHSNHLRSSRPFCTTTCKWKTVRQETVARDSRYKKPRNHGSFHVKLKRHDHHKADRHGLVFEHVIVAEQKLKRPLREKEIVHHINFIKNDNRPENLFVCSSVNEHFAIHGSLNRCVEALLTSGALIFNSTQRIYELAP